jgi:hypothetical protein
LHVLTHVSPESYLVDHDRWKGLASHCSDAQPINGSEILQRQENLAKILYENGASAYIAEPGANAQYFGNISEATWHLSERPLLLIILPTLEANIVAKVTVLTPAFEETRARSLSVPGIDVSYVSWAEDEDPYTVALHALSALELEGPIYVDGMMRHFIVDGLQKAAPGVRVMSAPPEVTQLRARKSQAELDLLRCANEVSGCIRIWMWLAHWNHQGHRSLYPGRTSPNVHWDTGITSSSDDRRGARCCRSCGKMGLGTFWW